MLNSPKLRNKSDFKVTLIDLPLTAEEQAGSLKSVENLMPSLGIGYIAAVLEKNGYTVRIIDCRVLNINVSELIEELKADKPNVIGYTGTVLHIYKGFETAKRLKNELPGTISVIGGPHITSIPEDTLKTKLFDVGVIGEAEYTFLELINKLYEVDNDISKVDLDSILGIAYIKNDKIVFTGKRPFIDPLDQLPHPARHLYPPLTLYRPVPASYKKLPMAHVMTSRGCPNTCTFCDRSVFGMRFRYRTPMNVVDEIEQLIKVYGAKEIKFFDDVFTLDKKRVYDILDECDKRGLNFVWSCLTRTDLIDLPLLKRMKKSGCWQVAFGIESGSQKILDEMKKRSKVEVNAQAVKWANEAGISVRAFFIFGMPSETKDTIQETIDFATSVPIDVATFYTLTLYPGNDLYEEIKSQGKLLHEDYTQYNPIIDKDKTMFAYIPDALTAQDLKNAVSTAYRKFYFRPDYVFKQILKMNSLEDVKRNVRGVMAILST